MKFDGTLASIRAKEISGATLDWYFMTFLDGTEHLGAAIVKAYGPADAMLITAEKNIDPGRGRVVMTTVAPEHLPADDFRGRLLTKAEVASFWSDAPSPQGGR